MWQCVKYDQKAVFFINHYKDHILFVCYGNMYGQKNILVKMYNLDIMISFEKDIKIFTKFEIHIWNNTPAH